MKLTRLSATELKRNTAEVLNSVVYGDAVAIVERYGEPLVKITRASTNRTKKGISLERKLKEYFGAIPKFPSVSSTRYFRKRNIKV